MPPEARAGRVQLVGAGPGAADLLTLRALRAIEGAEALLYDALISEEVLALAPSACVKIQTGKRAGRTSMKQETINRLMLRLARRGLRVVRLKGGDPSVFGRVGEEVGFLHAHGVETEVVPGVTAACAAAAEFGFPLTHRGVARRVVFTTARLEAGALQLDWAAAADPQTTLAIYMGGALGKPIAEAVMAAGRCAETPVLAVEGAGTPVARGVPGSLAGMPELGATSGPVLLVIGDVVRQSFLAAASRVSHGRGGACF